MQKSHWHRDWDLALAVKMPMWWEDYQRTEWSVGGVHRGSAVDEEMTDCPKMVFSSSQQP